MWAYGSEHSEAGFEKLKPASLCIIQDGLKLQQVVDNALGCVG